MISESTNDNFYITLNSNSSTQTYTNNIPTHFRNIPNHQMIRFKLQPYDVSRTCRVATVKDILLETFNCITPSPTNHSLTINVLCHSVSNNPSNTQMLKTVDSRLVPLHNFNVLCKPIQYVSRRLELM